MDAEPFPPLNSKADRALKAVSQSQGLHARALSDVVRWREELHADIRKAVEAGAPIVHVAEYSGYTRQRIHQIINEPEGT